MSSMPNINQTRLFIYLAHGALLHLPGKVVTKIAFYDLLNQINERGKDNSHYELVAVIDQPNGDHSLIAPSFTNLKRYIEYNETVHKL